MRTARMGKEDLKLRSRTKAKTKFEEYLDMEMGMQNHRLSAEEDLELERKLAQKLKVKSGKLRGVEDGMNVLFEGLPSIVDSPGEDELPFSEEFAVGRSKKNKKEKKRKILEQSQESEIEKASVGDGEVEETSKKSKKRKKKKMSGQHQVTADDGVESPCAARIEVQKLPVTPQKYIAPNLRLHKGIEPEDHTQLRRRVRGG